MAATRTTGTNLSRSVVMRDNQKILAVIAIVALFMALSDRLLSFSLFGFGSVMTWVLIGGAIWMIVGKGCCAGSKSEG